MPVDEHFRDFCDLLRLQLDELAETVASHDEDEALELVALYCEYSARMAVELKQRIGDEEYDRRISEWLKRRNGVAAVN